MILDEIATAFRAGKSPRKKTRDAFLIALSKCDKPTQRALAKAFGPPLPKHARASAPKHKPGMKDHVLTMVASLISWGYEINVEPTDDPNIVVRTFATCETIDDAINYVSQQTKVGRKPIKSWWNSLDSSSYKIIYPSRRKAAAKRKKRSKLIKPQRNADGKIILASLKLN